MRILITMITVYFIMLSQVHAEQYLFPHKETQIKASESLVTLNQLISKQKNFREMGFESSDELKIMNIGEPLQVFIVRLDHLKGYQKGMDADKVLRGGNHFIYPVLANNQVRSSITIAGSENKWKAVSFGNPTMIKLLTKTRAESAKTNKLPLSSYFIVQVPALNFYFLGYRIDNKLMLTPLRDDLRFAFKQGTSMSADEAFTAILPEARKHDGLPR
ncbi:MAG: hypothetical protein ABIK92_09680 [Pseudomonadota bacterium]